MKRHAAWIAVQHWILILLLVGLAGCKLSFAQDPSSATTTSYVTIPPLITLEPQKDLVFWTVEGIELPCIATGTPKPSYRWEKNGTDFDPSDDDGVDGRISIRRGVGTLIFTHLFPRDEGVYQCFAYNVGGIALTVKVNLRPTVLQPFQKAAIRYNYPSLGSSLQLGCIPPTSFPTARIFWATTDRPNRYTPLDMSDRVTQDLEGNLNFVNIMDEDFMNNKTYTCTAYNRAMRSIEQGEYNRIIPRGVSVVYYKPAFMWYSPAQQTTVRGDTIAFKCIFSGSPTPTVNWLRSGKSMSGRARFESFGQQLTIDNVQYDDAGKYECEGINNQTMVSIQRSFDLVVESAPYWVTKPESVNVSVNEAATFTCVGDGIPNPSYFWFINGVPITEVAADPRRIATDNTLTFRNLTTKDTMVIQCNVTNKYGYNFTNAYLNVLDDWNDATTTGPGTTHPKMYASVSKSVVRDSENTDHRIKDSASVVVLGEDAKILVILFVMFRLYETIAIMDTFNYRTVVAD